jgi:tetratricopeptide (TPR) repeat protein
VNPRLQALPPLVGRDAELGALTGLLDAAAAGRPQTAVLEGPAGIGKSCLADALAATARARGFAVARGRGWPDGDGPDLWAWRAIARDLGLPPSTLDTGPAAGAGGFDRFVAVLDRLRVLADTAPQLVVLDDAHLADAATLRLATLVAREPDLPLLLLLARRTNGEPRDGAPLADLAREALVIDLPGLSSEAAGAYVAAVAGRPVDAALLRTACAVTKGNPRHLRTLAQRGLAAGGLEGGLERAFRDRLDELTPAHRRTIATAALAGPDASTHEVARLAEASSADVAAAVTRAAALGLLEDAADPIRFVHDGARREAVETLPLAVRFALHERACAVLAGATPDAAARRAHHAIEAARGSSQAAAAAIPVLRDAAGVLRASCGVDAAAALLQRAIDIQAGAQPDAPMAALAVEHADAVLASGRLADARPLFQAAARAAEREGDAIALARAALGLGGVWVSEHRLASDVEAMLALQRRARDRLPDGEDVLRARLTMRLAAEEAYRGSAIAPVLAALDGVRRTGDARTLAEALSLAHHALLTPEHTTRRLVMAHELIASATQAGDDLLALVGLCWRAVDLFQLGHGRAPAALEELRVRAELLGCRSLVYVDVMLAIRAGDFARAETAADACAALGREVGDADALAYHGAHLAGIRYFQGREGELAGLAASIAGSPTLIEPRERSFMVAAALFACRAGNPGPGRALLDRLAHDGLGTIPASNSWLTTIASIAELAFLLDDVTNAQAAYGELLRYASMPIIGSIAVVCFGSAHRPLALAALGCGNLDLAIEHFGLAITANDAIGHRPAGLVCRAELGLALVRDAVDAAERLGMTGLPARWREAVPPQARTGQPEVDVSMTRAGDRWRVAIGDAVATVDDRVGLRYLAVLVAAPERGVPVLGLVLEGAEAPADLRDSLMDARALAAVRGRIAALRNVESPSAEDRRELAALVRELARATGFAGRLRRFADAPERARTAVRKALKRAIDDVTAANPAVGHHLAGRIETGTVCCYHRAPVAAAPPVSR